MSILYDKILTYDNPRVTWCPSMDLIGVTASSERLIEVHRCGYKHQKVFAKEDAVAVTSLLFAENGRLCAAGYQDGKISILMSDTAEEIFTTKIVDVGSPVTALWWQQTPQLVNFGPNTQTALIDFDSHLKSLESLDTKLKSDIREKLNILTYKDNKHLDMLFSADVAGNIFMLFQGHFPIACFKLKDIIQQKTQNQAIKIVKLESSQKCDMLVVLTNLYSSDQQSQQQGSLLVTIDTRIITSRILNQEQFIKVFQQLPMVEEYIKHLDSRITLCKNYWTTFYKQYNQLWRLLDLPQNTKQANPLTEEIEDLLIKGKMSTAMVKFLNEELMNVKLLTRLDENAQIILTNIEEEISEKMLPIVEKTLILLSDLRGLTKAKQVQLGNSNAMFLGLNEALIQKMIDFVGYYYYQAQKLAIEIIEAKVDIRNLLVFLNNQIVKLANNNPQTQNPQDIEQAKCHLAKLNSDNNRLLGFLGKGDYYVKLHQITKVFEEGQFKLPTDVENDIVQSFACEDLVASIKQSETKLSQSSYQSSAIKANHASQQVTTSQSISKRVTRRSQISSNEFARGQNQVKTGSNIATAQIQQSPEKNQVDVSEPQAIPFKTLTTRVTDLLHKQMRKPLESLSSYFRALSQVSFENAKDRVLDVFVNSANSENKIYVALSVESQFLVFIEYTISTKVKDMFEVRHWSMKAPEGLLVKEAVFHINSFNKNPDGSCPEELIVLLQSVNLEQQDSDEDKHFITIVDIRAIFEEQGLKSTVSLDQSLQFKASEWIRQIINQKIQSQQLATLDLEDKVLGLKSNNVCGLQAGQRGLFSAIIDNRKLTIFMTDFQSE